MSLAACAASADEGGASASAPGVSASVDENGARAQAGEVDVTTAQLALDELSGNVDVTVDGFNGDGVVDGADFLLIQQKFGGPPAVPATAAVPEPGSLLLALAAFGLPLAARRHRS